MILPLKKIKIGLGILLMVLTVISCNSDHKEGDGHDHGTGETTENGEPEHGEEESSTITSLTGEQIKAVGVSLGKIEQRELSATIKARGILRVPNNNRANATSLYGGVIQTLNVQLGDPVRKGQVMATIVNPQFVQLQEDYLTTMSEITLAEQELYRQQELNLGNAGSKRNLQNATNKLNTLRTKKASLEEQIQLMGISPTGLNAASLQSSLKVTSPINGVISAVYAKLGSYVDVSSPLVEIVDNNMVHLDLQVFERDLPKMKVGQVINFNITNNPSIVYKAKVIRIGASFENQSKTIAVHSEVTGDKNGLIDGMNITGTVSLDDVAVQAVPDEAIVEADGKYYVFVHTEQEGAHEHTEGEDHDHSTEADHTHEEGDAHDHEKENQGHGSEMNFEKIEVAKGVSNLGYTAITPVKDIQKNAKIVVKGAFFINAKMSDSGEHAHAH